jgi:SAM-dependent methyltransferase
VNPKEAGRTADVADYEQLGGEYYDSSRHPTCRNFQDASARLIESVLPEIEPDTLSVDVGAARSVLMQLLLKRGHRFGDVLVLDSAPAMLEYSRQFQGAGALLTVADATLLPLRSNAASLIVASLGDAFNTENFWKEVARCLRPGALCIFTTPAYEWAKSFRQSASDECENLAYFQLADERFLYVPSIIHSVEIQCQLIRAAGLRVSDVSAISAAEIPAPHSPKILVGSKCDPVLVGYSVIAPAPA